MTHIIKAIIGFPRLNDNFTLSGGSWETAFPLSNALNDEFARVARSTSADEADTRMQGTTALKKSIRAFGIAAHNMTIDAEFQLKVFDDTDSPSVVVFDSLRQKVWPSVYDYAGRIFETFNFFTGQYTEEEIAGQIPFLPILIPENVLGTSFTLDFFDSTNPAGFIDIGLIEITTGWEVSVNPENGASYGYKFFTRQNEIDGGLRRYEVFPPSYVFQGEIPYMDRSEVQNNAVELFRQHGIHKPFMWIPHPNDPQFALRNSKMVNLVNPGLFSYIVAGFDSVPLNLEEYKG